MIRLGQRLAIILKQTNEKLVNQFSKGNKQFLDLRLTRDDILKLPSSPAISPSYPFGPFRFIDREYLIITYETDPAALRKVVPAPLVPQGNTVLYEWINMPDSSGFGSYSESGAVIPCLLDGQPVSFTLEMYLDNEPPIACGREIWGFPKKFAVPQMGVQKDTLVGRLSYCGDQIAMGTMAYKYNKIPQDIALALLRKNQCVLKFIPDVDWGPRIAQLIGFQLTDIVLKEAWEGPARLEVIPHVNAPLTQLPVLKVLGGKHIKADITLPYGKVLYDYINSVGGLDNAKEIADIRTNQSSKDFSQVENILKASSMPLIAPSFHKGPLSMDDMNFLIFKYETNPQDIAKCLPEPLIPFEENEAYLYFTQAKSSGMGEFDKVEMFVPCYLGNELVLFGVQSYLNSSSCRTAGREVFGQPEKCGDPHIEVVHDTLKATLKYSEENVAFGTMSYKFNRLDPDRAKQILEIPMVNLKFIPSSCENQVDIAQLTKLEYSDVRISSSYQSPCQLSYAHHVNAPLKDVPVVKALEGYNIQAEATIRKASVVYDYILQRSYYN